MLFAFTVTSHDLIIWALAAVVAALLAVIWFKYDERREDRRRKRIELANILETAHLHFLSQIATDLAVVDLSGLLAHIRALVERVRSPADLLVLLAENFEWQLDERLKNPELAAKVLIRAQQAIAAAKAVAAAGNVVKTVP